MMDSTPEVTRELAVLPLTAITPNPRNPRSSSRLSVGLTTLVASIRKSGLQTPITVRPTGPQQTHFEILAGERRFRACRELGHESVPAIVVSGLDDATAYAITVTENLQREDLSPLEEAEGIAHLLELCRGNVSEAAARVGKPASWVARRNRLLNLSAEWRAAISDETSPFSKWPASHLEIVARIPRKGQNALLDAYRAVPTPPGGTNVPPLAELRKKVTSRTHLLSLAPWQLSDPNLVPEAGSCATCPKRSSCQPALFDTFRPEAAAVRADDLCLDAECWERKRAAFSTQAVAELIEEFPHLSFVTRSAEPAITEISGRRVLAAHLLTKGAHGEEGCFATVEVDDAGEVVNPRVLWARFKHRSPAYVPGAALPAVQDASSEAEDSAAATAIEALTGDPDVTRSDSVDEAPESDPPEAEGGAERTGEKTAPSPSRKPSPAKTRAASQARLEARRGMFAAKLLRAQLSGKKASLAPEMTVLLRLLAAFGTAKRANLQGFTPASAKAALAAWIEFDSTKASSEADLQESLWMSVRKVLCDRLERYGHLSTLEHGATAWKEVRALVNTLGLDRPALEAEVARQIPEPKSWKRSG